jgi:hypothetical protein
MSIYLLISNLEFPLNTPYVVETKKFRLHHAQLAVMANVSNMA